MRSLRVLCLNRVQDLGADPEALIPAFIFIEKEQVVAVTGYKWTIGAVSEFKIFSEIDRLRPVAVLQSEADEQADILAAILETLVIPSGEYQICAVSGYERIYLKMLRIDLVSQLSKRSSPDHIMRRDK